MTKKTTPASKARSSKAKPAPAKSVKKAAPKPAPKKAAKPLPKKTVKPPVKSAAKSKPPVKAAAKPAAKVAAKPSKKVVAKPAAKAVVAASTRRPILKAIEPIKAIKMPTRPTRPHRTTGRPVRLPDGYAPNETEEYMSPVMVEYFRSKLTKWKQDLLRESSATLDEMRDMGGMQEPDISDRATLEIDRSLELRARDRERKLISKIDEALERIRDGSYGFCEETGEPIGVKRLEARPVATLSVEAQERHERKERARREEAE
ncbi:MAG: RNA polymerase-binding protein DksA [Alphaproteobacteria bacterium]|nr:MAG: RNA polymerase-binding protein DksA [Alphaproteobacteria bacterium]